MNMSDGVTGFVSEQLLCGLCLIAVVGFEIIEVQWNKGVLYGLSVSEKKQQVIFVDVSQASAIEVSHVHEKPANIRGFKNGNFEAWKSNGNLNY